MWGYGVVTEEMNSYPKNQMREPRAECEMHVLSNSE
jgi:hypothetical protein